MQDVFYKILDYSSILGIALMVGFILFVVNISFSPKKSIPAEAFKLAFVMFACLVGVLGIYNPEEKVGAYTISPSLFSDYIVITYKVKEKTSIIDSKGSLSNQEYDKEQKQLVQCPFARKTMCLKVLSKMNEQNLDMVVTNKNYQIKLDKITYN